MFKSVTDLNVQSLISDVQSLKISKEKLASKYTALEKDFETVLDGYSQYGLKLEDLDKNVDKLLNFEEDFGKLKTCIQRLEDYVFTGSSDVSYSDTPPKRFSIPSTVPFPTKIPSEYYFGARKKKDEVVEEVSLQQVPSAEVSLKKVEIEEMPSSQKPKMAALVQKESEEIKQLRSPKEKFRELAKMVKFASGKGYPSVHDKHEKAKEFKVQDFELEGTAEIIPVEEILPSTGVKKLSLRQLKQFPKAAHALTNLKKIQSAKYLDTDLFIEDSKDTETEAEIEPQLESSKTAEIEAAIDLPKVKEKKYKKEVPTKVKEVQEYETILLFEILEENSKKLKEELVLYIKKQVNPLLNEFYLVESEVKSLKLKIGNLKLQIDEISSQLIMKDSDLQDKNKKLNVLENIVEDHDRFIKDALEKLERKAESDDVKGKAEKKDVVAVERTLSSLCDVSTSNITALENMIKECVTMLRRELQDRLLIADIDVYSEPLENKIKKLERKFLDKPSIQHFHNIKPIEIKQYVHSGEQKNLAQIKQLHTSSEGFKSFTSAYDEMKVPISIQTGVKKKMENAEIRGFPHIVDGSYTKIDFRQRKFK
nr:E3 ubiquitin-protein ligase bre-1 isoform X1 [Parasteatoda tepidariorum]